MRSLARIGVAIDEDLLTKFDALIGQRGYSNRSEAFRDLIRNELVEEAWKEPSAIVAGSLTLVYDHHVRMLSDRLLDIQHDHHDLVLSTMHVHMDHDNCLEVLALKGPAADVYSLANSLIAVKGVKHGKLTITSPGKDL